ncbi:phosphotransferase enzyme family protein [Gardnerella vaginalis]|uniref:Phosphotransferase enzyme family protein n=1 Tax=Gardnerella vaginalis TaxID=2702 RepID=A0A133NM29_GARVA|nr:phosphotransferase [Gardnerella vaginalis]KXA17346.1 phosphotransferase enzyme family protein [Gardnerella vaginalis]
MENESNDPQLDIVAQRWANVDLDEANTVCSLLEEPLKVDCILSHSLRPMAAGSLVRAHYKDDSLKESQSLDVYIKRCSTKVRQASTIRPYHRFAEHLLKNKISTPKYLYFNKNSESLVLEKNVQIEGTLLVIDDCAYEVTLKASGEDRYKDAYTWDPPKTCEEAKNLGVVMAKIALASQGFDEPNPKEFNAFQSRFSLCASEDVQKAAEVWLKNRPDLAKFLKEQNRDFIKDIGEFAPTCRKIYDLGYANLKKQWTHGDPHISNFMWEGSAPSAVFDLAMAYKNTAIYDLAMTLERNTIQWVDIANGKEDSYRTDLVEAILQGYSSVRALTDVEKELLPLVLSVSQIEQCVEFVDYYLKSNGSYDFKIWGYDTGFLEHARWYKSCFGERYLNYLTEVLQKI